MRAVVLQGPSSVTVEDVPDAVVPGDDGAVVRVTHTAICGSDLHLYHGNFGGAGVRLGHEFVGTVEEVGPAVRTLRVGDPVLVSGVVGCGRCGPCLARRPGRVHRRRAACVRHRASTSTAAKPRRWACPPPTRSRCRSPRA